MFLSKLTLIGLRKKKKKLDKKIQPQVMLGLGSKATLSKQETWVWSWVMGLGTAEQPKGPLWV